MGFVILGLVIAACVGGLIYIAKRNKPGTAERSIWPTSAVGVLGLAVLVLFVFGMAIALIA